MIAAHQVTVRARWILPVDTPPLPDGFLTYGGERILALGSADSRPCDFDLGDVALLPGLVNAHTHLELGLLADRRPSRVDFTAWLREIVAYRRAAGPAEWRKAIEQGITASLRAGTTLLGDISTGGMSAELLAASGLRAVCFFELLGLSRTRARAAWRGAVEWLRQKPATPNLRPGLSPHAPYSVRRSLLRLAARRRTVPLAIHLAETSFEETLLTARRGPLRSFLEELGAWEETGPARSLEEVDQLAAAAHRRLYVHVNYPTRSLLDRWAGTAGVAVVYCPRTHAGFGHAAYPLDAFAQRRIPVALGTDSLASNPDLSVLGEARFLWRSGKVPAETLLGMATLKGARALGWDGEMGSLTPGKLADWIALPLPSGPIRDPIAAVLEDERGPTQVVIGGRWLVRDGVLQREHPA